MAGGLGSFLLIIKQNLAQTYLSSTINGSSAINASASELTIAASTIIGTSQIDEAFLFNYLADKKITNPNKTISDSIEIAIPIVPEPIEEVHKPCPPPTPPPFCPVSNPINKSYMQLAYPIQPIAIIETPPPQPVIPPAPACTPDLSITKSGSQLNLPINPIAPRPSKLKIINRK